MFKTARILPLIIIGLTLTLGSIGDAWALETNFVKISLAPIANYTLSFNYINPPTGDITLAGVPFTIPEPANMVTTHHDVDSYSVDVAIENAISIYILINSGNTWIWFDGQKLGEVILEFTDGSSYIKNLIVGGNIREWREGNDIGQTVNWVTDPNSKEVFRGQPTHLLGPAVIDMLSVNLPQDFAGKTLSKVTITDIIPGITPHINWSGLTVEQGSNSVPTPFLDLPWDYQGKGLSFEQAALNPFSWFDHQYPLQNQCCDPPVMNYKGKTIDKFYRSHNGYDYGSQNEVFLDTPVLAAAPGWATFKSWQNSTGAGNVIKIDHENGYQTWYEHLNSDGLVINDESQKVFVQKGQSIGEVGMTGNTTGPHIHFSVFKDRDGDNSFDDEVPLGVTDPLGWEGKNPDPWPADKNGAVSFNLFIARAQPSSALIQTSGGTLNAGNAKITVPAGAADQQFNLIFKNGPFESISDLIKSVVPSFFLNAVNGIGQEITQFSKPINISYDYSDADLSNIDEDSLKLYSFNEQTGNWDPIPTILDKINDIASGEALHFSQFALMGEVKDLIAPTTGITVTGDKGQDNWYRSNVTVQLNGKDNDGGIGLQYTLFTLNGNDWLAYTQPLIFDQEGSYQITYQSYDKAENKEERETINFNIDKTPPIITTTPDRSPDKNGWHNHPTAITFSAIDTGSGVDSCIAPIVYSGPDKIDALVSGTCIDRAGNIGAGAFSFKYDASPPEVSFVASPNYIWPPNGKMVEITVNGNALDAYLYSTNFSVDDEYAQIEPIISNFGQTIQLEARREGSDLDGRTYIIKVVVDDLAGNTSEKQVEVMVPHDQRNKKE